MGICDDVAAMIRPSLWPERVIPFIERYFAGQITGRRSAHIEDLVPDHLPYLDVLKISSFDPSVWHSLHESCPWRSTNGNPAKS